MADDDRDAGPDDGRLTAMLRAALDDGPPSPPPDRIAALRSRAEAARARWAGGSSAVGARAPAARSRWLAVAAAVVALALGFGVATAWFRTNDDDVAGVVEYDGSMVGPDGAVDASIQVVATGIGRVVELRTDALPILPTGELYAVWFVAADDAPGTPHRISAGTFHPDPSGRSDVRFAAAVDPARYPIVEITAEPGGGNPLPTGPVVLRAEIPPP